MVHLEHATPTCTAVMRTRWLWAVALLTLLCHLCPQLVYLIQGKASAFNSTRDLLLLLELLFFVSLFFILARL